MESHNLKVSVQLTLLFILSVSILCKKKAHTIPSKTQNFQCALAKKKPQHFKQEFWSKKIAPILTDIGTNQVIYPSVTLKRDKRTHFDRIIR